MPFEVEQKFPVADLASLERALLALGAKPEPVELHVDAYFNHPARDFAETDEALRIRRRGEVNCVTYKGPKLDAETKTRREIELPLAPGDPGAGGFAELLVALGFRAVAEVRKRRRPFAIPGQDFATEATLDEVEGVGTYAELEIIADEAQLPAAKAAIADLAARLNLTHNERRSYLELLLEAKSK